MAKKETTVEQIGNDSPTTDYAIAAAELEQVIADELEEDLQGEEEATKALVPVVDQDIQVYTHVESFKAGRAKRIMQTSYTGAEKISIDDLDQRQGIRAMHVQGCHIEHVPDQINKETGEVQTRAFNQVLFKLTDGRVVSAGGKMAEAFAHELIMDLGDFDWPEPLKIIVRQHKGKNFEYPNFQVIE